tara:strand:- start:24267 stop:26408 length:2142 start_codon:yes stop_codon:yes gene_type:complete
MKVFALKNLATSTVATLDLDTLVKNPPTWPSSIKTKADRINWREDNNTDFVFYSTHEGINTHIRLTEKGDNQTWVLHGLVFDFDQKMTPSAIDDAIKKNMNPEFPVRYTCQSRGGACHVIFAFEEPIQIMNQAHLKAFKKLFAARAGVPKLGGGLDKASFEPHMYYTFGTDWKERGGYVKKNILQQILFEVGSKSEIFETMTDAVILPFDVIEENIEKLYPGKWKGGFRAGARGVRFWDATAKDPSACVMHATGIYYFTEGQGFMSWKNLFGQSVVTQYEADRIGAAVADIYYDGKRYWRLISDNWLVDNKGTIQLALKKAGLRHRPAQGANTSELEDGIVYIDTFQRVQGGAPFIYNPNKIVQYNNERFVNTASVKVVDMADHEVDLSKDAPDWEWMLSKQFSKADRRRLEYWLAWHVYNAIYNNPQKGQALFLVGGANQGKTLLAKMIGYLMGGSEDIGGYLMGRDDFNENMFKFGIATVDDDRCGGSQSAKDKYSATLKQLVANPDLTLRAMYTSGMKMSWPARIIVTLNNDSTSLSMLPGMDMSIADKLLVLRLQDVVMDWPVDPETGRGVIEQRLKAQAHVYVRYLHDLIKNGIPEDLQGGPRFGVKAYIDPTLREEADFQAPEQGLKEMVDVWRRDYFTDNPKEKYYFGNGTQILELLSDCFESAKIMEGLNSITLPKRLNILNRKGVVWIEPVTIDGVRGFRVLPP